ncbi:MAG TPA: 2Fe-2S iron-sulfur cluster-binding protein [Verrucomicrobiae bacterium]|nr:2Fe-2S iron-sulfur cluster-binding protein [Verrucomicrobiae bacterium]
MQSIFDKLQVVLQGNIVLIAGYILLGILLFQGFLMLYLTLRRIYFEREHQRLSRQRLQLQVKAAALQCREVEQAKLLWNGYRKFQVAKKAIECQGVCSFYLAPHDGKPLPPYKPGQYVTFQLNIPGAGKPVVRCYSLSDSPHRSDYYRVTIKKEPPPPNRPELPPGVASSYFCDQIKEGDILDVKAPGGSFFLDLGKETPVVLVSGGVGVTPMLSMAHAIAAGGSQREVWFFFGARNRHEHIHKDEMLRLAAEHENIRMHVCYSRPDAQDRKGIDFHHEGRVSVELFKELLPSNNYEFFLCGNGAFMKSISEGLEAWGVPDKNVFFEAFGPATVKKKTTAAPAGIEVSAAGIEVTFSRSGKKCQWLPAAGSLLDFAVEQGVKIDCGCRAGSCGSCLVAIKSGDVDYLSEPGEKPETGSCLTCICKPRGNLVLDA